MGCLQGSNLGPLLWNIYQNDLFYLNRVSSLSMYADDHQLYYAHSNVKDLMDTIRTEGDHHGTRKITWWEPQANTKPHAW